MFRSCAHDVLQGDNVLNAGPEKLDEGPFSAGLSVVVNKQFRITTVADGVLSSTESDLLGLWTDKRALLKD